MIATEKILHGVSVACVTPMTDDGTAVGYDAITPYVDFLCDRGVDGLFVVGTTGEGCLLSLDERRKSITEFVRAARGRVVVVSQCGSLVAEETKELLHHSAAVGADGAAVVTPFYFSYSQAALYDYYAGVLEMARGFPIYAYNIPQLTNNAVDVKTMARLATAYPNFCGVKDSSGNATRILEYVRTLPDRIAVIVGSDPLFLPLLFSGIRGCVSGPG
ncbi:MAG TPA: dihydrodipicolinate synthase family protein, partial [Spirochaetia bacterium]